MDIEARDSSTLPNFPIHDTPTSSEITSFPSLPKSDPSIVEIGDPPPLPLNRFTRPTKSTKLLDFSYFTYSGSFASFIANIHHLSEPKSYREIILDHI